MIAATLKGHGPAVSVSKAKARPKRRPRVDPSTIARITLDYWISAGLSPADILQIKQFLPDSQRTAERVVSQRKAALATDYAGVDSDE